MTNDATLGSEYVNIYNDTGKLAAEKVPVEGLDPSRNSAIVKILYEMKRTIVIDLDKIQRSLRTGEIGGEYCKLPHYAIPDIAILDKAEHIRERVEGFIRVSNHDDTRVELFDKGKRLLIQLPKSIMEVSADYTAPALVGGSATAQAIVDEFEVDPLKAQACSTAIFGRYPSTIDFKGGAITSALGVPLRLEHLGYGWRTISSNVIVSIANKNAMKSAALSGCFEMSYLVNAGNLVGRYRRLYLLGFAYECLNAENLVYDTVRVLGKKGTTGRVICEIIERALERGVVKVKEKLPSGFTIYEPADLDLWNAYAASGMLAASMVNCGAARCAHSVSSVMVNYNEMLLNESGLPDVEFGRAMGTGLLLDFLTHALYGGGEVGLMNANHPNLKTTKLFAMPCVCAATALDAGTLTYPPEKSSGIFSQIFKEVPEFKNPFESIAEAALKSNLRRK
ncbi:MAG: methyl-coenzyme M reductase subunit beta [Candidatus Methanosuratus sp.]|nr:methyl-coenzyme M reductase subunit beta [Candidatus Methanosuratincola sp.]